MENHARDRTWNKVHFIWSRKDGVVVSNCYNLDNCSGIWKEKILQFGDKSREEKSGAVPQNEPHFENIFLPYEHLPKTPLERRFSITKKKKVNSDWSCQSASNPPTLLFAQWLMNKVAPEAGMKVRRGPERISFCQGWAASSHCREPR